jgi:phosphatidylserine/phosphatidylglycerophosphate/cardiolipin synthase-like enzyme
MNHLQASARFSATGWPWRTGNRFELLHENERFFGRMLESIAAAREYILLEMYLAQSGVVSGWFVDALARAAREGRRVCMVLDGFGSLGLSHVERRRLTDSGVELRFFNPLRWSNRLRNLLRDHRKLLLVDGRVAFVGGVGLTDEFALDRLDGCPWRDLMVEMSGPIVADWQRAFARTWRQCGGEASSLLAVRNPPSAAGARGRVVLSEARRRSVLARGVIQRIDNARARVWIMSAYFVSSRRLRKALRRAARRGVEVRLLVPGPKTDHPWVRHAGRRFYGKMLRNGVNIYEYQPRMLHGKMTICDGWVSIGSANLDRWSFRWNLEANQEIDDPAFASIAAAVFARDCEVSAPLSRRHWPRRAWLDRMRERIAGALDVWLDRWRRPRGP